MQVLTIHAWVPPYLTDWGDACMNRIVTLSVHCICWRGCSACHEAYLEGEIRFCLSRRALKANNHHTRLNMAPAHLAPHWTP